MLKCSLNERLDKLYSVINSAASIIIQDTTHKTKMIQKKRKREKNGYEKQMIHDKYNEFNQIILNKI